MSAQFWGDWTTCGMRERYGCRQHRRHTYHHAFIPLTASLAQYFSCYYSQSSIPRRAIPAPPECYYNAPHLMDTITLASDHPFRSGLRVALCCVDGSDVRFLPCSLPTLEFVNAREYSLLLRRPT